MKDLNNQDIQNRVSLFFDNALEDSDRKELLDQVQKDPHCQSIFKHEENCRKLIKDNFKRPPTPTSLIQSIKNIY